MLLVGVMGLSPLAWAADDSVKKSFRYDPAGHRDPFVPLVQGGRLVGVRANSSSSNALQPTLHGILWDPGGQSIALINDGEAKVGDVVNGYTVKEIRRDSVVVTNGEQSVVLQIAFEAPVSSTTKGGGRP